MFELNAQDPKEENELRYLKFVCENEKGHGQWGKQTINLSIMVTLVLLNLVNGSKSNPSIVGIERCSTAYWLIQTVFIAWCVFVAWVAVKSNAGVQYLKSRYGDINFVESDIILEGSSLVQILLLGFVGGWVAGALGLGGGSIYNPALLSMGVPPKVSSATGMYLVLYSTIAASLVNFLNDKLNIQYGIWISFWSVIGTLIGLALSNWYMKVSGR